MTLKLTARITLFVLLALGAMAVYLQRDQLNIAALELWVSNNPSSAPLLFILVYLFLTILFFPSTVMSLAGGILFGPFWGSLYSIAGATLSAASSFVIARYLAADWLECRLGGELRELKHGVERKGWRFVLLLRIIPGLPFALLNYALGLTRIHLLHFAGITALCILPRVVFLSYAGYTGKRVVTNKTIGLEPLLILLLLGAVIVAPYLFRRLWSYARIQP